MGVPESDISIPEPRDEFRKARLSFVTSNKVNAGFELFRLTQSMGIQTYGADISDKSEGEKRDFLIVNIAQYISDIELGPIPRDEHGNEKEDIHAAIRNKIFDEIASSCVLLVEEIGVKYPKLQSIQSFNIDKGVLSLFVLIPPRKDVQVVTLNLTAILRKTPQRNFQLDEKSLSKELNGKTKENLNTLRQSLETYSFFDGAIVVSYEKIDTTKKIVSNSVMTTSGLDIIYRVSKMLFRDENGRMQEVDPKIVRSVIGDAVSKTKMNTSLLKIMQKIGRVFNSVKGSFTNINTLGVDKATEKVKSLKRADIEQGKKMTDAEFEQAKSQMISELARTPRSALIRKSGEFLKGIPGKGMHYVFWGVFFQEYHRNTHDIANFYKGITDTGLFYIGANIVSRVAPGVWKAPASLIGGGLAIMGGHAAGGAMNLDKKIWRMMPERVEGDGKKSVTAHVVFGGAMNDVVDKADTDLGIPGTRGGAVLYNPTGKDGIMPNVDFAGTHISFGTNPREYLQSRIGGTDKHWNLRMDEYITWSTNVVMRVLWEYDNKKGYFSDSNVARTAGKDISEKRQNLLRERLRPIFDSEDGKNRRNSIIIEDCVEYITKKVAKIGDLVQRKEMLSMFLGNYGNILKIDEDSLNYDSYLLARDKTVLDGQTQNYLTLLSPEKQQFTEKVFSRLQKGEGLVNGKRVRHAPDVIGPDIEVFKPDREELKIYRSLIDDETPVKNEWYDILGYTEPQLDHKNLSFSLPDKIISLGGKKVYFRSYFNVLLSEYGKAVSSKKSDIIASIDTKYGLNILSSMKSFQQVPTDLELRSILLENILRNNPDARRLVLEKNKMLPPTQGDVFVYLLNLHTEYREQKRYIDTQKSMGYANKWTF